eukprot:TRINITY_DN4090_c0_g1_i2.p1 TRINITY_DN4090_c0_g1~~TRINITY_DN4090_c0_g1_i2.p1  ORF type:complete len:864 (-),score=248.79 TRINITY_DN4090_c0_g1_i2:54-2645(-)
MASTLSAAAPAAASASTSLEALKAFNPDTSWRKEHWLNVASVYSQLVNIMASDLRFCRVLASHVDSTDFDYFSRVIVNVLNLCNQTLPFIKELVFHELSNVQPELQGSLMRANNIISKVQTAYARSAGAEYIKLVLHDLLEITVMDENLNLEIDREKIIQHPDSEEQKFWGDNADKAVLRHQQMLENVVMTFIYRITDPDIVHKMPLQMRAIAGFIREACNHYQPESSMALVGGFVMLRLFGPAIVTPEAYGILPADVVPSPKARRNLILIAKVLQNIANGGNVPQKESYMLPLQHFTQSTVGRMTTYLGQVASVQQDDEELARLVTPVLPVEVRNLELQDLFELHRIVDSCSAKLLEQYRLSIRTSPAGWVPSLTPNKKEVLRVLGALGPPPRFSTFKEVKAGDGEREIIMPDSSTFFNVASVDTSILEKARFLYQGPNAINGSAVFYIICNRVRPEFLNNVNPLLSHIFKTMDAAVNSGKYNLVVDMSWAHFSKDMRTVMYKQANFLWSMFSRTYKKNLDKVYIIHPNSFTRTLLLLTKSFTSRKLSHKIKEVYAWTELTKVIKQEHILIPESSKGFITKSYVVTKVNSKGRHQERMIKFTLESLLNIEPKTNAIHDVKLLSDIEEIYTCKATPELFLKFATQQRNSATFPAAGTSPSSPSNSPPNPSPMSAAATTTLSPPPPPTVLSPTPPSQSAPLPTPTPPRVRRFTAARQNWQDQLYRRYICNSTEERDAIIQDIFTCCFKRSFTDKPQDYQVATVNNTGKKQDRTFKMTMDSLLCLNAQHQIKYEISFAGIEDVSSDIDHPDVVMLKLKPESNYRKIVCPNAKILVSYLQECIYQYRKSSEALVNMMAFTNFETSF